MSMTWEGGSPYESRRLVLDINTGKYYKDENGNIVYVDRKNPYYERYAIDLETEKPCNEISLPQKPEDIIIDKTYFKISPEDNDGEGQDSEASDNVSNGENSSAFDFEANQSLQDAIEDLAGMIKEEDEEENQEKISILDSVRLNIKKKFRF